MTRYSEVRFTISMKQKSMGVSSSAADRESSSATMWEMNILRSYRGLSDNPGEEEPANPCEDYYSGQTFGCIV